MSYICKAQRSRQRARVSDLFQTILPVHSKWNERKGSTPPAFFSNLQGKLLSQIHWGDWWGKQDNSSPKEDIRVFKVIFDLKKTNSMLKNAQIFMLNYWNGKSIFIEDFNYIIGEFVFNIFSAFATHQIS